MALPVYRRQGIMYADLPRVETANLKEGAAAFDNINRKLDQLQTFVTEKGTEYAKQQAKQYAAQNPVTEEQIAEAVASQGEQKSWLSALTGGNVYDDALKAAQGSMLSNQLSIEAAKKFRQLQVKAENNQLSFDDAQTEIQDIIDGYATTISAFSPEASIKARASMATTGNGVLKSVAEKQSKIFAAAQAAKLDEDMHEFSRIAADEFARGDSWNPATQTYIRAEDRIQTFFQPVLEQANAMGQEDHVPNLYKRLREARVSGVVTGLLDEKFAANHTEAYNKIINGDLGEYESSWAMMDDDDRDAVMSKFLNKSAERRGVAERQQKEEDEANKEKAIKLQNEVFTADRARQIEIGSELAKLNEDLGSNFTPRTFLRDIESNKLAKSIDNDRLIFQLNSAVDDGVLDNKAIEYLAENEEIDWDQAFKLQNRIKSKESKELTRALKTGKAKIKALGLPSQDQTEAIAEMETQVYDAPPDVPLQDVVDAAVARQENDIRAQRLKNAKNNIVRQLKKLDQYKDMDDEELAELAAEFIEDRGMLPKGMPDKQRKLIQRAVDIYWSR